MYNVGYKHVKESMALDHPSDFHRLYEVDIVAVMKPEWLVPIFAAHWLYLP